MAKTVAAVIPPKTVQPIVCLDTAPAPVDSMSGIIPKINAKEVIMMGRNLNLTASKVASSRFMPISTRSFANSTMRIAFFAARPIMVTNQIFA